jgi:hypothetical protein
MGAAFVAQHLNFALKKLDSQTHRASLGSGRFHLSVSRMKSPPRLSPTSGGIAAAAFCCVVLTSGAASAQVNWKRVGTVTTLTSGQLCKTDGTNVICDSTTPSISASNFVGIGSTAPVVSLDDSQNPDAIALPGGSNAQRPTGAALVNGEIRYNTSGTGQVEAYYNGAWNSLVTSATLGTSTPAAGSTGQVQFNSGGYLGASSNLFWNNSSGYLGIGTTSPQQSLSVIGSANVTGYVGIGIGTATAATPLQVGQSPAGVAPSLSAENGIATFRTSTTPELQIGGYPTSPFAMWMQVKRTSNDGTSWPLAIQPLGGNVGIGTTAPNYALDIGAGSGSVVERINGGASGTASGPALFFANGGSNYGAVGTYSGIMGGAFNQTFTVWTNGGNLLLAPTGGNVGIGTTAPNQTLQVNGDLQVIAATNTGTDGIIFQPNNQTVTTYLGWAGITTTSNYTMNAGGILTLESGSNPLVFETNGANERMRIDTSGNVGIGTTGPNDLLDVVTPNSSGTGIRISRNGSQYLAFNESDFSHHQIAAYGTKPLLIINNSTTNAGSGGGIIIAANGNGNHALDINENGNVLIGGTFSSADNFVSTAASALDVYGGVAIGTGYAGVSAAPTSGVIIQGNVGIGTTTTQNKLDAFGGVAIGTSYAGVTAAPTNGMIVQGNVGIGSASPATGMKADIAGPVKVAGTGSEPCTAAQVGAIRYNPSGNYFELCSYP